MSEGKTYFENARFIVTASDITTKNSYFPIGLTTGRIRRDFLFTGLAAAALIGAALWIYVDLWTPLEKFIMAGIIAASVLILPLITILEVNAKGFPTRLYVGSIWTIRKVFTAITQAKAATHQAEQSLGQGLGDALVESNEE